MRVFTYNTIDGINSFSTEDYGSITSGNVSASEDYSQIPVQNASQIPYGDPPNNPNNFSSSLLSFDDNSGPETFDNSFTPREDYSYITNAGTIVPFGSIANNDGLSGQAVVYVESFIPAPLVISGTLTSNVIFTWTGNGTLFEIGSGLERTIKPYVASGTLRVDQTVAETALERVAFAYNLSSIVFDNTQDYGLIAGISTEGPIDFGQVSQDAGTAVIDYQFVQDNVIALDTPFGQLSVSGSAEFYPNYRLYLDGQAVIKVIYSEVSVGAITFADFGRESRTYVYDETSVYDTFDDYGFVAQLPILGEEEFGSVGQIFSPFTDYGLVSFPLPAASADFPFGSIYISSFSSDREIQVYGVDYVTSGTITLSGNLVYPDVDYTPSPDGSGTITISGSANDAYVAQTPEDTQVIIVSEILGLGKESRRYVWDESSLYSNVEDFGLVTQPAPTSEDYQDLFSPAAGISYGFVNVPLVPQLLIPPFGSLFITTSFAETREIAVYQDFVPSGLFTISGTPLTHPQVDLTPHYGIEKNIGIGTTAFVLTGAYTNLQASFAWLGTGSLFGQDFGRESRTYVYNEFVVVDEEDWQLITLPPTEFDDPGSVSNIATNFENYGFLNVGGGTKPFGTIKVVNGFSPQESYPWLPGPGVGRSWNYTRDGYIGDKPTYTLSGVSSNREIAVYGYYGDDNDPGTSGLFTISGNLVHPNIDLTPHYGIEENIGVGTTGIQITGLSTAIEKFIGEPLVNTQLFVYSSGLFISTTDVVPSDLKATYSEVGVGTFTFVGEKLESDIDSYVASGIITISGTGLEAYSAQTPEDTVLFNFDEDETAQYNRNSEFVSQDPPPIIITNTPLVHPEVDLIPHYGIEKNIGVGTTGIRFVPGAGFEPDGDGNPRDAKTYSNRYGFQVGDFNSGSGIGTFKFDQTNNTAKYSPLTPYTGTGLFNVITGFSPQEIYPYAPLGIGKSWSFTRTTYISSGIATISGIASTREINVYGYYGDDRNPGTSGTIFISQETAPIVELEIDSYAGTGTVYLGKRQLKSVFDSESNTFDETNITFDDDGSITTGFEISEASYSETDAYSGTGTLTLSSTAEDSYSVQTPENTQLFNISGTGFEVYSAQTPETEVLYIISGVLEESTTNSYDSSGSVTIGGSSTTFFTPNYPARGLLRFVNHNVDNDYDTCDSEELTSDRQDSAHVSFTANPVEDIVLFDFDGSATTAKTDLYEYVGFGLYTLSGTYQDIKLTHSESGIGTIFIASTSLESERDVYIGSGTLFGLSGGSESYSTQTPESTIILQISGSATTSIESDYPVVGIGLFTLNGSAITSEIATYTQIASGSITLSGQLVYPDIIFVPSPDGTGTINILGSSNESFARIYGDITGNLFAFSSGFESFAKSTYTGIGTIYIQEVSGSTINNPFQIPRTYVVII